MHTQSSAVNPCYLPRTVISSPSLPRSVLLWPQPPFVEVIAITRYLLPIMDRSEIIAVAVVSVTAADMIVAVQVDHLLDDTEYPPLF